MKKTFKYMTLAAAAVLTAACSQEDFTTSYQDDPNAVQITAQVGEGDVSGGFVTRSTPAGTTETEDKFNSGDRISVSTADQGPVVYAYNGSAWNPENGKFLKWTSSSMIFTAYYPVADGVDENTFAVPTDQTDANKIATADYMTCSSSETRAEGNNGVTLAMQRKMARIVIVPALQTQFTGYEVTAVTVHGNTAGYSGGNTTTGDLAVNAYKHTDGNFYALLSPTTANNDSYFIDVTVTKGDVSETLHAKGIPATTAGNSYTVNLTVGRNVANITGITIKEWTSGETIGTSNEEAKLVPYITFSAENEQTFTMNFKPQEFFDTFSLGENEYFEYSVGGGKWTRFTSTVSNVAFGGAKGNLRLRGKSSKGTSKYNNDTRYWMYSKIEFTNPNSPVQCTGDIRTLIDYENYATADTENARFYYLFSGCTALTTAPELPATTLADYCYYGMFTDCSSLTQAPQLPAQTLKDRCYCYMFNGCSSLTTAPELSAMTLDIYCYSSMFQNCTSLTTAPELPATELKDACYYGTFQGCTSLKTAPVLHATTLVQGCYNKIFNYCPVLENVTMLATGGFETSQCLDTWLGYYKEYEDGSVEDCRAGQNASTRTLTLANEDVYNKLVAKESTDVSTWITDCWKADNQSTTIMYQNNQ
ncbi:MAG: fimbrillin family protein [Prevotella sp.]